jgi:alpha-beta hydrolase superfamily lysophospholipase
MSNILLVHGAWHGPWCWDDFAQRFRQQGHDIRAVRLRGHDQRPGRIWHRVRHYVDDVKRAAGQFDHPPVWSLRPFIATPGLVRELFFAPDTPREVVDRCRVRLQDEVVSRLRRPAARAPAPAHV